MDENDFFTFAAALQTYFPRYDIFPNEQAMELWYRELKDIPYELLTAALRAWVNTEKWPPSIAELRERCAEIVQGPAPDWGEAWKEVSRAIGRFGTYRPEEALASMSELTRRTVERMGWKDLCLSENPDTVRAQFRQVYQTVSKREIEDRKLPQELKSVIQTLQIGSGNQKQIGGTK